MKYLIPLLLLTASCSTFSKKENTFKLVHWNIKELNTKQIAKNNDQIRAVENILSGIEFDVLSVQEIQFDLPNVPNKYFHSEGKNAENLLKLLGKDPMDHAISFYPSNTGMKAYKSKDGYESVMNRQTRKLADQNNFGLFPAQYSTALISSLPIKEETVIKDLKWVDFNKAIKLSKFKKDNGDKYKNDLQLFDKGFSDVIVELDGKEFHIITLHAVPAYHFGNNKSPNYERNRDQLRFLEWYLTGGTDITVNLPKEFSHIKPLDKNDRFIAVGDWNTSIYDNNEGSVVLRRLFQSIKLWIEKPSHTHEQEHFGKERLKLTLDYIAYRGVELLDSGIYYPDENNGVCIKYADIPNRMKARKEKIDNEKCINEKSVELKSASDHFPIWAEFKVN